MLAILIKTTTGVSFSAATYRWLFTERCEEPERRKHSGAQGGAVLVTCRCRTRRVVPSTSYPVSYVCTVFFSPPDKNDALPNLPPLVFSSPPPSHDVTTGGGPPRAHVPSHLYCGCQRLRAVLEGRWPLAGVRPHAGSGRGRSRRQGTILPTQLLLRVVHHHEFARTLCRRGRFLMPIFCGTGNLVIQAPTAIFGFLFFYEHVWGGRNR